MEQNRSVTAPHLRRMKERGERIVVVTAYDYPSAHLADEAGVDVILVGDSLGMVVLGHKTTVPVTLDDMLHHTRAVARAQTRALVVADMPFLTYQVNGDEGMRAAGRLVQEGGAQAVKLEGAGHGVPKLIGRLTEAGIPVMGHVGLTPQSVHGLGGWKAQGRTAEAAGELLRQAESLQAAGVFALVLEAVPTEVAGAISRRLSVPTIGIGAGAECDGQVQVLHDILGLYDGFLPRHARRYAELGAAMRDAIGSYAAEVRSGDFPADEHVIREPGLSDPETWK